MRKLFLPAAALLFPPALRAAPAGAAADVHAARAALDKHEDGFWLDAEPASAALLGAWYAALRRWTAAELASGAGASGLARDAKRLDKELRVQALRLPGGAWLVSAGDGAFGTVFALAPHGGRLTEAWSLAAPQPGASPSLAAWRPDRARALCKGDEQCGPLTGSVQALPAEQDGSARFLIFGTYTTPAGATVGGQLSVWRWRGAAAEPLLAKDFAYMIDERAPVLSVAGDGVRLRLKDEWQHLFACGGCSGRQVEWRWRLAPRGLEQLGARTLFPELDLVDALVGRIVDKRPTADLASDGAAAAVRRLLADNGDVGAEPGTEGGLLYGWTRRTLGADILLCLNTDGWGTATYRFARVAGALRLTAVVPRPDGSCGKRARS